MPSGGPDGWFGGGALLLLVVVGIVAVAIVVVLLGSGRGRRRPDSPQPATDSRDARLRMQLERVELNLSDHTSQLSTMDRRLHTLERVVEELRHSRESLAHTMALGQETGQVAVPHPTPVEPDLVALAREFLNFCEQSFVDFPTASEWFASRYSDLSVEVLEGAGQLSWGLLRCGSGARSVIIPAIRRPMGDCSLARYFELRSYNGIEPLKAAYVVAVPQELRLHNGEVRLERGLIDAR